MPLVRDRFLALIDSRIPWVIHGLDNDFNLRLRKVRIGKLCWRCCLFLETILKSNHQHYVSSQECLSGQTWTILLESSHLHISSILWSFVFFWKVLFFVKGIKQNWEKCSLISDTTFPLKIRRSTNWLVQILSISVAELL